MKRAAALLFLCACTPARSFEPAKPIAQQERVVTMPTGDAEEEEFRAEPPKPFARRERTNLTPTETRLANGVRVVMLERHDFPTVATVFVLDRGAIAAPPAVASLYAHAMTGSSRLYKSRDAWDYLRFVGAGVHTNAGFGAVYLHTTSLSPFLRSALSRAAPMFAAPSLASEDVERARAVLVADRKSAREEAGVVAHETLYARLFPAPHPLGVPIGGASADQIKGIGHDAIASFRDMYLSSDNVAVVSVGDFKPTQLTHVLEDVLAPLPKKKTAAPKPDEPPPAPHRIVIVDRPGAAQSNVAIGFRGPAAAHRDLTALQVLAITTGAGLSSSLNLMIRKELGATYGVHMRVRHWRSYGAVEVTAGVDTPRTADALRGMIAELRRRGAEPLAPAELTVAKAKADYDLDAGTNAGLAYLLAGAIADDLPTSFVTSRSARIDALSAEDIRGAAERWLSPAAAQIVVVGDASRIEESIRALGIAQVEVQHN